MVTEASHVGTTVVRRVPLGRLARWVLSWLFGHIALSDEDRDRLLGAFERGSVIFVSRAVSWIDRLFLRWLLATHSLPGLGFVHAQVSASRAADQAARLLSALEYDGPALLFLRRPLGLSRRHGSASAIRGQLWETLLATQRSRVLRRPILFVPFVLIWGSRTIRPVGADGRLTGQQALPPLGRAWARLWGHAEEPGRLRTVLQLLLHRRRVVLRLAEPLDLMRLLLASAVKDTADDSDEVADAALARRLRFELSGRIERERRVVVGPPRKSTARLLREVLRGRALQYELARIAATQNQPLERVVARAKRLLDEIAADPQPWAFRWLDRAAGWLIRRLFEGVDVDDEGIERVRDAARKGPVLLFPSHRSHLDYLVLSYVLAHRGLVPPYVAAGVNLSFFPLGPLFRRGGAFFLRRRFGQDALYSAVFRAYVHKLLRERASIEVFVEGGRSRTGAQRSPRLGLLSMIVDAVAARPKDAPPVSLVPLSIGYDHVVEARHLTHERAGGLKRAEGLLGLLRSLRLLARRRGRVHLYIAEPMDLPSWLAQWELYRTGSPEDGGPQTERRRRVASLGAQLSGAIAQAGVITSRALVSAALLRQGSRGVPRAELETDVLRLLGLAVQAGGHVAAGLHQLVREPTAGRRDSSMRSAGSDTPIPSSEGSRALDDAIELLRGDGVVEVHRLAHHAPIYRVPEAERLHVAYYKNQLLDVLGLDSVVAQAVLASWRRGSASGGDDKPTALHEVHRRSVALVDWVGGALVLPPDKRVELLCKRAIERLVQLRFLQVDRAGRVLEVDPGALVLIAGLTTDLFLAYESCLSTLLEVAREPRPMGRLVTECAEAALRAQLLRGDHGASLQEATVRPESCCRVLLADAVRRYLDQGVLSSVGPEGPEPRYQLAPAYRAPAQPTELVATYARLWRATAPPAAS